MKKNIVYLTGFMGAGKSTIGPILANTLGWNYYDLDRIIEGSAGITIREIFERSGESSFRKIETEKLIEISSGDNLIISLGGGTISSNNNLQILKNHGYIIYLRTSLESVSKRLIHKNDRPLLKTDSENSRDELMKNISNLLEARKPFYEQADYTVDTENVPIGKTVDHLAKLISSHFRGKIFEKNNS